MMSDLTQEAVIDIIEQSARARRLAFAIAGDPAAERLEQLADELDAEVRRRLEKG